LDAGGSRVYSYFVQFESIPLKTHRLLCEKHFGVSLNIIRFLKETLKKNTWKNGDSFSKLLYALYLNDLPEELEGGIDIDGRRVNVLMYADRIAILSESIDDLQDMINQLEKYCTKWDIVVDMDRSCIMVFRRGGRLALTEKWFITGKEIKTTSTAEFLDFLLTTTLNTPEILHIIDWKNWMIRED